jgi:prophage DNA circulation protein
MNKKESQQAAPILQRSLAVLVGVVPSSGRAGSDLRTACGALSANAEILLLADQVGPPLAECFDLARAAGATQAQLAAVRNETLTETPTMLGAVLIKNSIIQLCLVAEGNVIASMVFTSRQDVDALRLEINTVFVGVEETVADDKDQMTYQSIVSLHAAITYFLTQTARPLPRVLQFAFAAPMPTLVTAMRLYSDGGRADELRAENKVVHPAFMPPTGQALSA